MKCMSSTIYQNSFRFRFKKQIDGIDVIPVINTTGQCVLKDSKDDKKSSEENVYTVGLTIERHVKDSDKVERLVVLYESNCPLVK